MTKLRKEKLGVHRRELTVRHPQAAGVMAWLWHSYYEQGGGGEYRLILISGSFMSKIDLGILSTPLSTKRVHLGC